MPRGFTPQSATDDHAHILQLFDTTDSLATSVSAFLFDGWNRGEHLIVVAKSQHWKAIRARLQRRGCQVAHAIEQQRLTILDAHRTLGRLMHGTVFDEEAFQGMFEPILRRAAAPGRGVRVYGEMVEILAEEENYGVVHRIERLWNDLAGRLPFHLLCGYSAAHFADDSRVGTLQDLCRLHTRVNRSPADVMGSWLHHRWQAADRERHRGPGAADRARRRGPDAAD